MLVATTVIEVGVDVPNATIMIVQEADRFGLAQLHQLRGRVGRGAEQSYCLLVSRPKEELTETAIARLEALVETADGFQLAEVDLELRGAGELLGTRQSGLTDFRYARLVADRPLLELARAEADALADYEGPLNDEIDASSATTHRSREDRRRLAKGREDLRPEGSGHETHLGSRARGDLRDPRLGGGRERPRPLRGLGRARPRGAVARRRERDVRRIRPAAVKAIERNLEKLGLEGRIVRSDAARYVARTDERYDVVFVDPPYEMVESLRMPLAEHLPRVLAEGGSVVFETAAGVEPELPLPVRSTRRHGSTQLTVYDADE